ncbi:uncharacterized protein EURHEDRAFT_388269 [Aspergillus ruber CBS 135680]|uniref:Uncharacterized protein n=1 Tax=Aspergillus ruber (strain CBS 135680) TaxID=1388766 RepID=A0A017S879_ASPRC|nr:uncharacterized protein EURHEDRAFT_388269 [Aspergillus ruber CBS 135680]EYE92839.1 hypothetical protein EURHEDRAFT_388269 [Aspergillus ruber CBS 135680]
MPRGSEYANAPAQSDNAIEAGENKAHGTSGDTGLNRVNKVADFPEGAKGTGTASNPLSGQGSAGHDDGKGGHEPKTLGENKGLGAHKA